MTLLMTVGLPIQAHQRRHRRLGAHDAALAFERFEQRCFLAADVRARAFRHLEFEAVRRAEHAVAEPAGVRARLSIARFERRDRMRILAAHVDVADRRAGHDARDDHPFDQHVGIAFHHRGGRRRCRNRLRPHCRRCTSGAACAPRTVRHLMPAGNAAPPRPRRPDSISASQAASPSVSSALLQAFEAAVRDVVVDGQRIGDADARECQALLLLQIRNLIDDADVFSHARRRR